MLLHPDSCVSSQTVGELRALSQVLQNLLSISCVLGFHKKRKGALYSIVKSMNVSLEGLTGYIGIK